MVRELKKVGCMDIKRVTYNSPVEAYDAIVRTLVAYEAKYNMSSTDFFL